LTLPEDFQLPPPDDELPPPPSDIAEESKSYGEIKTKKSGPSATMKRAFTIFEKDLTTMAKHGLVSAVILFIFLAVIFNIMSFAMSESMRFDIGESDDGNDGPGTLPNSNDHTPPVADAGSSISVVAGTMVTLDASDSTDDVALIYYMWMFSENSRDIELYGRTVHHTFYTIGHFEMALVVVDSSWNMNETRLSIDVTPASSDNQPPNANGGSEQSVIAGSHVTLDGLNSTDNVLVTNWTWIFRDYQDRLDRVLFGPSPDYWCVNAGELSIQLIVRDAAGNVGQGGTMVHVMPSGMDMQPPQASITVDSQVSVGDEVMLDASESFDDQGINDYTWFIGHNNTIRTLNGPVASFIAEEQGMYEVTLAARDNSGNVGVDEREVLVYPAGVDPDTISWVSTPFGTDVSFNLLTYVYGIALLSSVIFVGGLFAKGFTHEIAKGTIKVLFFGPISVTTMIFSKILYPIFLAPIFIFPLMVISLTVFEQSLGDILMITLVSYLLTVVTMVAAAYGSCLLYIGAKKMVLKPSIVSRMFMYFSLLGTLTVFEWFTFVLDQWQQTTRWNAMYQDFGVISTLSPFHQGGMFLSNTILGTSWTLDIWTFAIPVVLIVGGLFASKRLYSDMFSRE
jgi:chitodextrinase